MDFSEAFLANFLANVAVALPLLALWALAKRTSQQGGAFIARLGTRAKFRIRFMWLVLTRQRGRSDFTAWRTAERLRVFLFELVTHAQDARAIANRRMFDNLEGLSRAVDEIYETSPISLLMDAVDSMSTWDFQESIECNPESLTPDDRVKWLTSQPFVDLARWSMRLNEGDRRLWVSWLAHSDSLKTFEAALFGEENRP